LTQEASQSKEPTTAATVSTHRLQGPRGSVSAYQNYLFGSAGSTDRPAWSDSTKGRALIRLVSRGIFGALFITAGTRYARTQLQDYSSHEWKWNPSKLLQAVAKGIDVTFGKAIQKAAWHLASTKGLTGDAIKAARDSAAFEATNFRPKAYFHTVDGRLTGDGQPMNGRSLGAEMVGVTFDFAMGSVGDALARTVIQAFDPNIAKPWMLGADGKPVKSGEKGHFDMGAFAKYAGRSAWRIFSKNQGEDWFAALPYVYQMKFQRQMIANMWGKRFAGTKIAFDNNWNGGALKVDETGKIIGDYQVAGAIDLHFRFVGYNWYTLMYREGYDAIANKLTQWKENGFKLSLPSIDHPLRDVADTIGNGARYVVKSFIKSNLYMHPAMLFFWPMRAPQTKWRAGLISANSNPDTNALGTREPFSEQVHSACNDWKQKGKDFTHEQMGARMVMNDLQGNPRFNCKTTRFAEEGGASEKSSKLFFGNEEFPNPMEQFTSPYDKRIYEHYKRDSFADKLETAFSKALNPFGRISYNLGNFATQQMQRLDASNPLRKYFELTDTDIINPQANANVDPKKIIEAKTIAGERFMRTWVDNSLSYTPYMWAKAETALRVDDRMSGGQGQMDKAIYDFMHQVATFNLRGTAKSIGRIWDLGLHIERPLISREGSEHEVQITSGTIGQAVNQNDAASAAIPQTKIDTASVSRTTGMAATNDNQAAAVNDNQSADSKERRWAESVAGRPLGARFQSSVPTHQ